MPSAEIVSIGSELLLGQIVDTNSAWIADRLMHLGVDLFHTNVVGDNPKRMREVISRALDRSDLVITGGGLGPTEDDLTREAIAQVTNRPLVLNEELCHNIENLFRDRGLVMTTNNQRQAQIPEGAIPIPNPNGTAPSFVVEDSRGVVFALPGVPFELKWLFDNEVVPYLRERFGLKEILTYRILKVAALGESTVDDRIGHLILNSSNPTVGVLAHPGQVDIRIAAKGSDIETASRLILPVEDEIRDILGNHIFAEDDDTIETVVGNLVRDRQLTISVYEDVTMGMVSDRLLQACPNSFRGGLVGNGDVEFPINMFHKSEWSKTPELFTKDMAMSVKVTTGSDIGLAVHGLYECADEELKSQNLGRGESFISVTTSFTEDTRKYNYSGTGLPDRTRLSINALDLLRRSLIDGFGNHL